MADNNEAYELVADDSQMGIQRETTQFKHDSHPQPPKRKSLIIGMLIACCMVLAIVLVFVGRHMGSAPVVANFFVIADIHLDYDYRPECLATHPYSCRYNSSGTCDVLPDTANYGRYGCDTPVMMFESILAGMVAVNPTPDFILVLGDMVRHDSPTTNDTLDIIEKTTLLIRKYFPDTRVLPSLGNNDAPSDYCLPSGAAAWLTSVANIWRGWLNDDEVATFEQGGYYVALPIDGVRMIALNTLYYSTKYSADNCTDDNPSNDVEAAATAVVDQMTWLDQTLAATAASGERAIIFSHMSPGVNTYSGRATWKSEYVDEYLAIVQKYSATILMQMYAHVHTDEFRVQYVDGAEVGALLLTPAIDPMFDNNPSFRYATYDSRPSPRISGYRQYYADLVDALHSNAVSWSESYDFTAVYQQPDVSVSSLHNLSKALQSNPRMLAEYNMRRTSLYVPNGRQLTCGIENAYASGYDTCVGP